LAHHLHSGGVVMFSAWHWNSWVVSIRAELTVDQ